MLQINIYEKSEAEVCILMWEIHRAAILGKNFDGQEFLFYFSERDGLMGMN